jgi:hypothetical protein
MKLKYWIKVVESGEPQYDIIEDFIKYWGQIGGYNRKPGENERQHCLIYWGKKDLRKHYTCSRLRCHEMLLHIAKASHVPDNEVNDLKQEAICYVKEKGRKLSRISPIATKVMKHIEKTEDFKRYDSLD